RSRIVNAIVSRISARLPPTIRWICTAVTRRSKSSDIMRWFMCSRASSTVMPRFISRTARVNSSDIGTGADLAMVAIAWAKEYPALSALLRRRMVSPSCELRALERLRCRCLTSNTGAKELRAPAMVAIAKLWLMKYTAMNARAMTPATARKYSDTRSLMSARASWSATFDVRGRLESARLKASMAPEKASRGLVGVSGTDEEGSSIGSTSVPRFRAATNPPKNSRMPTAAMAAMMRFIWLTFIYEGGLGSNTEMDTSSPDSRRYSMHWGTIPVAVK